MTEIEIRKGRPGDAADGVALLKDLGYPVAPADSRDYVDTFSLAVAHPEVSVFVAAHRLDMLGFVAVSIRPQIRLGGRLASIDELVVAESHRGQGLGRRLMNAAIKRAREMRCVRVEIQTNRARESYERGFYTKNGFTETDSAILRMELPRE